MAEQHELIIKTFNNMLLPVALIDDELSIIWANKAALKKFPMLDKNDGLSVLFSTNQLELARNHCGSCREQLSVPLGELSQFSANFVPLDEGIMVSFGVGLHEDSTTGAPADNLTFLISNQMRAPLTNIFASISSLARMSDNVESAQVKQICEQINESCYKMLRFTTNFTGYLKHSVGNAEFHPSLINLTNLVNEICRAVKMPIGQLEIGMKINLPDGPVFIEADDRMLTQAILHLFSNSCLYTKPENVIEVSLNKNDDNAVITVSDKGRGIPFDETDKVFEPFYSKGDDGQPFPGCGLGLTLVRYVVSQHKGDITISSSEAGTTVKMRFPITDSGKLMLKSPTPFNELIGDRFSIANVIMSDSCKPPEL